MKKFTYKNLKLFLYLCILLFIINCTFNNDDRSNIDIIEISQEINSFTKGCIFVAHNVKFDYRVLKKEFSRIGMKFQRDLLCTIELSKIVFPKMKSYSLGKLVSNLGIEIKNRHRADGDAEATLNLFVLLTKNIERDKLDKLVSFENE